ncbi:hypothetical protein [Enterococcus olivae]
MKKKALEGLDVIGWLGMLVWSSSVDIRIGLAAVGYFGLVTAVKAAVGKE